MKLQPDKKPVEVPKEMLYNSDFSDVVTIKENKYRMIINAICATTNLYQAALELGVSNKMIIDFCSKHNICGQKRIVMRKHFIATGKRIKLRFDYEQRYSGRSPN
jgi:predicted nucleic-acid-binding Zn-ribbon protein